MGVVRPWRAAGSGFGFVPDCGVGGSVRLCERKGQEPPRPRGDCGVVQSAAAEPHPQHSTEQERGLVRPQIEHEAHSLRLGVPFIFFVWIYLPFATSRLRLPTQNWYPKWISVVGNPPLNAVVAFVGNDGILYQSEIQSTPSTCIFHFPTTSPKQSYNRIPTNFVFFPTTGHQSQPSGHRPPRGASPDSGIFRLFLLSIRQIETKEQTGRTEIKKKKQKKKERVRGH